VALTPAGFTVQLNSDGDTYSFSIKDMLDPCHYAVFSGRIVSLSFVEVDLRCAHVRPPLRTRGANDCGGWESSESGSIAWCDGCPAAWPHADASCRSISGYRADSKSSIGFPSGSSTWIWRPTGPASI